MTKGKEPDDPAPVREPDDTDEEVSAWNETVTLLPEPDVPDLGEVDPADSYREGVDRDAQAGDRTSE